MKLDVSYKDIFKLSFPLMIGSAVQQVIALTDSVFLFHKSEVDFAAIGYVSLFYLMISAIGYGFSKGGQIIIARRVGEGKEKTIGEVFQAMVFSEFVIALIIFLFITFLGYYFFALFTDSEPIFRKSLDYLKYRTWGVFFSFVGLAMISLYTGLARTKFIVVDALVLAFVNLVLNYALIFGHWGFPEMGIKGAGLASAIAELVACLLFIVFIIFDKKNRKYQLFSRIHLSWDSTKLQQKISSPIVAQSIVGFGSYFLFFALVENMGERPLAVTNLVRMVYLVVSIPCWGFATSTNTYTSSFIGKGKDDYVLPLVNKISKLSIISTLFLAIPVVFLPNFFLYPFLGGGDMSLINESKPILLVLFFVLIFFSIGTVYFNGLVGSGATSIALKVQFFAAVIYLFMVYSFIEIFHLGLEWCWGTEILYYLIMIFWINKLFKKRVWNNISF